MGHWLDDIERLESHEEHSPQDSARIQDKKFRISQNYEQNKEAYESFLQRLNTLVERVNHLPLKHRKEFGKLDRKSKESHLDNHLEYYSSSRKVLHWEYRGLLRPLARIHYKHARVIYFYVSSQMGLVDIEVHDEFLEKRRYDGQVISAEQSGPHHHHHHHRTGSRRMPRFRKVFSYEISKLDEELAKSIIDWLVFKAPVTELPLITWEERRTKNEF